MRKMKMSDVIKGLFVTLAVVATLLVFSCKKAEDDDTKTVVKKTCPPGTFAMDVSGDGVISGSQTYNAAVPNFKGDPLAHYHKDASKAEYTLMFAKTYSTGTPDYASKLDTFDGFSTLFLINFMGTPATGTITDTTTDAFYMDSIMYSPDSTSDIYMSTKGFPGANSAITLTTAAANVGDHFTGTITGFKLCKMNADLSNLADGCATSYSITDGTFDIVRDTDD